MTTPDSSSGVQKMVDPYRPNPRLVCETCGIVASATLANRCYQCVAEDEDLRAARRVLYRVEMDVEAARQRRRAGGNP